MKTFKLSFFIILLFIFACSSLKKLIKYSPNVINRKIMNSLYEDSPVFSRYENVKLFIDSLDISSNEIEFGVDEVCSIICQILIDENAKIEDIHFHQFAGISIDTIIIDILNSSIFKNYFSEDSNRMQKYSVILPFYIAQNRILSPYMCKPKKSLNDLKKKPVTEDKIIVPYDSPPMPIGGFQKIQDNLIYPEIARKAGFQGKVVIQVLINEQGLVEKFKYLKSTIFEMDHAAVMALLSVRWKPAQKEGKPQKVWVSIPILFRLK